MVIDFKNSIYFFTPTNKSEYTLGLKKYFEYDYLTKIMFTKHRSVAAYLREYFNETAKNEFERVSLKIEPWVGRDIYAPTNKTLHQVQIDSIRFALERNHSYLALEQRIGKTPVSVCIINAVHAQLFYTSRTLIQVPPFLISNWLRELEAWKTYNYKISVVRKTKDIETLSPDYDILLVPDSLVINKKVSEYILNLPRFDLMIGDEWHRNNRLESQRSQFVYGENGILKRCNKVVLLSGTPARNKPLELWPVISNLSHNLINYRSEASYKFRYCDGRTVEKSFYKYGQRKVVKTIEANGSSNEDELHHKLQAFMKVEKFKDHFEVQESETVTLLDAKKNAVITKLEETVLKKRTLDELVGSTNLGDIATLRKEMSELKLNIAREYIESALNNTDDKFLVFGFHVEILERLFHYFKDYGAFLINGKTPMKTRAFFEDEFKKGVMRIGFANIFTMQGIDLSAANRNIFVESSWSPSDNDQAKYRAYGRHQTKKVFTEHLVIADTLDEYVMRKVLNKKETINKIIKTKGK